MGEEGLTRSAGGMPPVDPGTGPRPASTSPLLLAGLRRDRRTARGRRGLPRNRGEATKVSEDRSHPEDRRERRHPAGLDGDFSLSSARLFLLLFLLGALLYFQVLGCPFLWDEYRIVLGNAHGGAFDWHRLPGLFRHRYFHIPGSFRNDLPIDLPYYRPLPLLLHGVTYDLFGPFFPAYHMESLFLHIASTLLFVSLCLQVFGGRRPSRVHEEIILAAGLLFFVHPRNVETVSIIANQTGLLCAFFSLLSLSAWQRVLAADRPRPVLYVLSLLALLAATLSKETAYVLPLVHALLLGLAERPRRRDWGLLAGFFLLAGLPMAARHAWLGGRSLREAFLIQWHRQGSPAGYLRAVFGLGFHQLSEWLVPLRTRLFQYPYSPGDLQPWQIVVPAVGLLWALRRLRAEGPLLAFSLGWFLLFYLPSANLVSIGTLPGGSLKAGSHHLYPAHAGLCLLLAASVLRAPPGGRLPAREGGRPAVFARAVLLLIGLLLTLQSFRFAADFRTADRFYHGVIARNPRQTGAWLNYGWHKLYIDRDPGAAEAILLDGLEVARGNRDRMAEMDFTNNLIVLYLEAGRLLEAETLLQCVMEDWITRPVGNLYFWRLAERLEVQKERAKGAKGKDLAGPPGAVASGDGKKGGDD